MKLREGSEWLFGGLIMHEIKLIKTDGLTMMDQEYLKNIYRNYIYVSGKIYGLYVYLPNTKLISPIFDQQYLRR